ncbi:hypothetical protein [Alcanivorax sp.]|jgi:hypothetical protein|uniref:hypothetical protein n=1 Tax=Alcanivorax sp. TaxID=1872427 RepID=UPI0032D9261B
MRAQSSLSLGAQLMVVRSRKPEGKDLGLQGRMSQHQYQLDNVRERVAIHKKMAPE